VAACGIVPRTVDVALADGSAAGVDLKAALSEDGNRGRSRLGRFLLPLCILLAVAAPLGVILRNEQALAGLEARIAAAKQRAIAARAAEQQAAGASSAAALWLERRRTQPYATELWLEITRLLPDDVHAEELSIEGGTLSVDGMAGSAADLVPLLEGSPLLAEVTFASPVVLDPASGKERFSLRARIGAEAAP
jgi:general secretion pathway protein L